MDTAREDYAPYRLRAHGEYRASTLGAPDEYENENQDTCWNEILDEYLDEYTSKTRTDDHS